MDCAAFYPPMYKLCFLQVRSTRHLNRMFLGECGEVFIILFVELRLMDGFRLYAIGRIFYHFLYNVPSSKSDALDYPCRSVTQSPFSLISSWPYNSFPYIRKSLHLDISDCLLHENDL